MILSTDLLIDWYSNGLFPMAEPATGDIYLYSPDPRAIIDLNSFHISDSLKKKYRAHRFEIRINTCFEQVMRACAARDETWISEDLVQSYLSLHHNGFAHSIEVWMQNELAGGLYGVSLQGAFFGESMFHIKRDASKIALVALIERMKERNMNLLDSQYSTTHLKKFGTMEISREEYLQRLKDALKIETLFYP